MIPVDGYLIACFESKLLQETYQSFQLLAECFYLMEQDRSSTIQKT